jgi:hypothetical protein
VSTEEDRIWDAEQDYALLGPRPVGGYLDDDEEDVAEDFEPVVWTGKTYIVEPPYSWSNMDEHDPRL